MENIINQLIAEYTTGEIAELPKDYILSLQDTLKTTQIEINGEYHTIAVELYKAYYTGRKRKNIAEYPQVIKIDVYDSEQCGIENFKPIQMFSNKFITFLD